MAWGAFNGGDLVSLAPYVVAPSGPIRLLPTLLLYAACFTDVLWGLPLAEDCPHGVLSISELGGDVKEVGGDLRETVAELVYERHVCSVVGEGTYDVRISDTRQLIFLVGEPSYVMPETLPALLKPQSSLILKQFPMKHKRQTERSGNNYKKTSSLSKCIFYRLFLLH